ncbi:hypothetical protein [Streptomyces sp. NPDC059262]|uniref:hypothetical protein n=1 Tax=Streptomyces sp. NPDC059262 TaxID=3346797 RepID=UPI00368DB56A
MKSWSKGQACPGRANLDRLDAAYWTRRRETLIRSGWLKRHLDNDGRGRGVEIFPVDQSAVILGRERPNLEQRSITVRYVWADLVDAWAAQDENTLDEIWDDIITDLDSDYAAYAFVSSVGISA